MIKVQSQALAKLIGSMKRLENSRFTVNKTYWEDDDLFGDEKLLELLKDTPFDSKVDLQADIQLLKLIKVEDWYGDGTAVMRTLRRGKGRNPYTDSDIWCKCSLFLLRSNL